MNSYGKLRRSTGRTAAVVDFYLLLAAAIVFIRSLIHAARTRYRWPSRLNARSLTWCLLQIDLRDALA